MTEMIASRTALNATNHQFFVIVWTNGHPELTGYSQSAYSCCTRDGNLRRPCRLADEKLYFQAWNRPTWSCFSSFSPCSPWRYSCWCFGVRPKAVVLPGRCIPLRQTTPFCFGYGAKKSWTRCIEVEALLRELLTATTAVRRVSALMIVRALALVKSLDEPRRAYQ